MRKQTFNYGIKYTFTVKANSTIINELKNIGILNQQIGKNVRYNYQNPNDIIETYNNANTIILILQDIDTNVNEAKLISMYPQ
jgi:hypothetical protein